MKKRKGIIPDYAHIYSLFSLTFGYLIQIVDYFKTKSQKMPSWSHIISRSLGIYIVTILVGSFINSSLLSNEKPAGFFGFISMICIFPNLFLLAAGIRFIYKEGKTEEHRWLYMLLLSFVISVLSMVLSIFVIGYYPSQEGLFMRMLLMTLPYAATATITILATHYYYLPTKALKEGKEEIKDILDDGLF